MISDTPLLTVDNICKLALPLGTVAVASGDSLTRPVCWALAINADSPLPYLEGDELVLLIPGKSDATPVVRACAEANVAAVVTLAPLSPMALAAAEIARLPVLQLPAGSRVRDLERTVVSLLLDRQGNIERRSTQIYQQLVQLASENVGLEQIVHELAKYINKAVVVQDKRFRIQVAAVPPQYAAVWEDIDEQLTERNTLPNSLRDRHRLPKHTSPVVRQPIGDNGLSRLIAPIVNQDVGRGFLSFIGEDFDEVDHLIIEHAAVVCALEMARAKAISEIEKKLRGDFLDSLMIGTVAEAEALIEGDRFGHDMSVPHMAMVMTWYGDKHPSSRRLETLVNGLLSGQKISNVLVRLRENELRLFYANDSSAPVQAAREFAEEIRSEAHREYPDAKLAIGIGSLAVRVNDWRASYREAAQAADIARRLKADMPMYIGDLGIYTFLAHPDYRDDLRALRDSTIGNLLNYDERQRADLLLTLEAFFQCHGNHTQTAELLSVHRNTLFYRMNRIAEITGLDLNQPDVRLAVHLALKIHRLLTA
ncbi:MAG: helix-turn-helix domain-containing protein [Anaerolineae bacterium]|nr:helix-turn-helix domain-containing protein [Anaerolineae bacterium]